MLFAGLAGLLALTIGAAAPANGEQLQEETRSVLITNARVVDGTGSPARDVDVRIRGDRIADVGKLERRDGERVVDADRLVLAPGFIDSHSHFERYPEGRADPSVTVGQGITTVVGGHDGVSPYPAGDYLQALQRRRPPVNVAVLAGFRTLREQVRGVEGRSANAAQRVVLRALLRRENGCSRAVRRRVHERRYHVLRGVGNPRRGSSRRRKGIRKPATGDRGAARSGTGHR